MTGSNKFKPLDFLKKDKSDILVIGIVGAVGSGTSWVSNIIKNYFEEKNKKAFIIKVSSLIEKNVKDSDLGSKKKESDPFEESNPFKRVKMFQEFGDILRKDYDNSFLAAAFVKEIYEKHQDVFNDSVFIIDSLKNPAEVDFLRIVYGESFWLLGNVCEPEVRKSRLKDKFGIQENENSKELDDFILRDEDDRKFKNGQHVSSTFEKSDYFINTTEKLSSFDAPSDEMHEWSPYKEIIRFIELITFENPMLRPTDNEHGMYSAYAAKLGSACLSRQVGATLMNSKGEILSTGCNEVPRAGGGLYGQSNKTDDTPKKINEGRCYLINKSCKNTEEKNKIVEELDKIIKTNLPESIGDDERCELSQQIKGEIQKSKIGDLIEFSRSVHAEMDALISAARKGESTDNCRLFVTTFPCHNCARHIVAAGIKEVQFIEPYLKSKALELHCDSITQNEDEHLNDGKVLFKPYEGAAPRLYKRSFTKDYEVKDPITGKFKARNIKVDRDARPNIETISRIQREISEKLI